MSKICSFRGEGATKRLKFDRFVHISYGHLKIPSSLVLIELKIFGSAFEKIATFNNHREIYQYLSNDVTTIISPCVRRKSRMK
jgi:hypothetical protein